MVKLLLVLSLLYLVSISAYATTNWRSLSAGQSYKLKKSIEMKESKLKLSAGTTLKLVEKSDLNMIKVTHFKYKINNCKNRERRELMKDSSIELVPINNKLNGGISVGVNFAKNCILEVFVEESDTKSQTFFI